MNATLMKTLVVGTAFAAIAASGCNRAPVNAPPSSTDSSPSTPPASSAPANPSASGAPAPSGSTTADAARTAGQAVDDAAITAKVKSALVADDMVKGLSVNVDTSSGVVKLTGTVSSQAQIDRAVEVAKRVDGVLNVDNNLRIGTS